MADFEVFGHEPDDSGAAAAWRPDENDELWAPFDDAPGHQSDQVPPGYARFETRYAEQERDLQRRIRFALAVFCALRSATLALGLARLAVVRGLGDQLLGFQGWGLVIVVTVLYGVAAIGYAQHEGWARVPSVIADTLLILVVIDSVANGRDIDGVLFVIAQSVLAPVVSIVMAAKAGGGLRRPKLDWTRDD